jgi:uncharacterized membrane protein
MLLSLCVIIAPPLLIGLYVVCLKVLRGEEAQVEDVFAGFSMLVPAYGVCLLVGIIFAVLYLIAFAPLLAAVGLSAHGSEAAQGGAAALFATSLGLIVAVSLGALLLVPVFGLAFPAVADGQGAVEALSLAVRQGLANWSALFVLSLLMAIVQAVVGGLTSGLGSIVTMPWAGMVVGAAYLQVVGGQRPA